MMVRDKRLGPRVESQGSSCCVAAGEALALSGLKAMKPM